MKTFKTYKTVDAWCGTHTVDLINDVPVDYRKYKLLDKAPSWTPDLCDENGTPKKQWCPYSKNMWVQAKFRYLKLNKTELSYTVVNAAMHELPAELRDFPYNDKLTISELHARVADQWNAYTKAGLVPKAFNKLKERIQVYNDTISGLCMSKTAWVARADAARDKRIKYGIIPELQKQSDCLRVSCIEAGVKLINFNMIDHPEKNQRAREKTLLKASELGLQLPEAVTVSTKEVYATAELSGYAKYGRYSAEIPEEVQEVVEDEEATVAAESVKQTLQDLFNGGEIGEEPVEHEANSYDYNDYEAALEERVQRICSRPVQHYEYYGESEQTPTKYTDEDFAHAPKTLRVIRWKQDVTDAVKKLREDILILMTLYLCTVDGDNDLFLQKDEFGDVVEQDLDPAPTTYEEYRQWEQKREAERQVKFCGYLINGYYKK